MNVRRAIGTFAILLALCSLQIGIGYAQTGAGKKIPASGHRTKFVLHSPAIGSNAVLPVEFTGDGSGISPPLEWRGEPAGTKSFALIMHHIDREGMVKWYWTLYNIPVNIHRLPKNAHGIGISGNNSINNQVGYAPPHSKGPGAKTYILTLYALSAPLRISAPASTVNRALLLSAMNGHILATSELRTVYTRQGDDRNDAPPPPRRPGEREDRRPEPPQSRIRTRSRLTEDAHARTTTAAVSHRKATRQFQPLRIPEAISRTDFDLNLHKSTKSFWQGATTATYSYNKENFWGPTLILNQGDTVRLNVKNDLDEATTTHWHGLHIPAAMDGGPHQVITPGTTWSPSFTVKNNAGTYWYHPHAHERAQKQITYGAGGLIIVKDPVEAALALPRTYGVDDIPLALTSRRFYKNDQFSFEGDNDKYGDYLFANGTLDPEVGLPAQFVRLRILNAEIERGYNLGFSDNRKFYVIATDGGLVDKPIAVTRMKLMVGERVEILVDLGKDRIGSTLDLMAYNSAQSFGFPGGEPGTSRPNGGYLNNIDFRLLHLHVKTPTAKPITKLPESLVKNRYWQESDVTKERELRITADRPGEPFYFDEKPYRMHVANQIVKLGAVEKWTITNNRIFGHAFHIHDVQFKIVSRSSGAVADYEQGWKDTVYVPRDESVTFIAKFEDYASDTDSFMYHCHMSNHEDGGLMGEFLVVKDPNSINPSSPAFHAATEHPITPQMNLAAEKATGLPAPAFRATDLLGNTISLQSLAATKPLVLFFIERNCPCSRDATPFLNRLQAAYGDTGTVVGVINANAADAKKWAKTVGCQFPILPDPNLSIIRRYGAKSSVYTTLIAPGGTIEKTYPGYGQAMLQEIAGKIATFGKVSVRPLNVADAPKRLTTGCPFNETPVVAR